jgi:hypothetical protein
MTFELRYFRDVSTTDDINDLPWQSLLVGETSSSPPRIEFSSKVELRSDLYLVVPDARFGLKLRDVADECSASELGMCSSGSASNSLNVPKRISVRISTASKLRVELKVRTNLDASRAEAFSKYTGKIRLPSAGGLGALLCCHCSSHNPPHLVGTHTLSSASSSRCAEAAASAGAMHVDSDTVASAATSALADNCNGGCACEAKAARTLIELVLGLLDDAGSCLSFGLGGADADSLAALRAYATAGAVRLVLVSKRRRCGMAARALGLEDSRVECLPFAKICSASPPSSAPSSLSASASSSQSLVYRSASIEGPLPLVTAAAAHAHAWFTDGGHQSGGGAEWQCGGYPAFLARTFFGLPHTS